MNKNISIKVEQLTKIYKLYNRPIDRLKEVLNPFKKKYYKDFYALNNISFEIKKGEVVGIIGKNGSGKSTLLKLITQILIPSNGKVIVNGKVSAILELGAGFNPEMTGIENIYLNYLINGMSRKEIDDKINEIIEFSELGDFINHPIKTYSSGMRARLAFAVSINVNPDILIIDEVLSVGDGHFAKKSFNAILKLKDKGVTILFCSHSLYQIEAITNRVLWIDKGKIKLNTNPAFAISSYREYLNLKDENIKKDEKLKKNLNNEIVSFHTIKTSVDGYYSKLLYLETLKSSLTIEIKFNFEQKMKIPSVGIVISQNSTPITSISSKDDDFAIKEVENGVAEVRLEILNIPLLKGTYQIDAYLLCDLGIHLFEEALNIATLKVKQDGLLLGYMTIPHKWKNRKVSHIDFEFPLNLYAHLFYLDRQRLKYLHFGIFNSKKSTILEAQELATQIILEQLTSVKTNILEVGFGFGTTSEILIKQGFEYIGISPDKAQVAYVKNKFPNIKLICTKFENLSLDNSYDNILFQESSQYIEPINIFSQSMKLLKINGKLLIMDEFVLEANQKEIDYLNNIQYFIKLAERFGFKLIKKIDFSNQVSETMSYAIEKLNEFYEKIKSDLNISEEKLKKFKESLYKNKSSYINGNYGYFFLVFEKKEMPKYILDKANKYSKECQVLFKNVFKEDMSKEFWEWKYKRSNNYGVVLLKDDMVVGHYGGMVRDILFFAKEKQAIQPCDTMIDILARGGKGKYSRLSLLIKTFLENTLGYGKEFIIAFGFPNQRVMTLCSKLNLYQEVNKIIECQWFSKISNLNNIIIDLTSKNDSILIDNLWKKMSLEFSNKIIGVRNWDYFYYRYISHPKYKYFIYKVYSRDNNILKAIIVVKKENNDILKLMDIISLKENYDLCIQSLRNIAFDLNYKLCSFWITSPELINFNLKDAKVKDINISVAYDAFLNSPNYKKIKNKWWLTYGDTDFI